MLTVEQRNAEATRFTGEWLERGAKFELTPEIANEFGTVLALLDRLIPIKQAGFRGIVLTSIVGKHLNREFSPFRDFYECNPRSIFEHGIRLALESAQIPCGKSDPLNVAKNIQIIDRSWAQGKRPESAAIAAVDFLKMLEDSSKAEETYAKLLELYFFKLTQYGIFVRAQNQVVAVDAGDAPLVMGSKLAKFVVECPESGAIPQFIVGHLIDLIRKHDSQYDAVGGYDESVFGTNTTSKKPADVWEVMSDTSVGALYEITVKAIDWNRLSDCAQSLVSHSVCDPVVTFICRIPEDIEPLKLEAPYLSFKGVRFQFLEITSFVQTVYCLLSNTAQQELIASLQNFVFDHNRKTPTKQYWARHFALEE